MTLLIGLLMAAHEDDILPETLPHNAELIDHVYALSPHAVPDVPNLRGVWRDDDLPDTYPRPVRDGARQFLLDRATEDHGHGHWYLLLHADESWRFDPRAAIAESPDADGLIFRLPLHIPREPWNRERGVLEQLEWALEPGYPEFRMFRGDPGIHFQPDQHFLTQPQGLTAIQWGAGAISHYPYRSPESQRSRADHHRLTGFDPDNYKHVQSDSDEGLTWTDAMIEKALAGEHYETLGRLT